MDKIYYYLSWIYGDELHDFLLGYNGMNDTNLFNVMFIVLGIISLNKNCEGRGMAIAGIVCGGIGALVALTGVIVAAATGSIADSLNVDELYDIIDSF